ncbi:MAG: 3-dehydroquinate synthase [Salinivirgaceae bacterium]|jgi:3-dehydroquinate synthase|nr:3-dehydroquinate synthase [Salinivirgaceae bacterium]
MEKLEIQGSLSNSTLLIGESFHNYKLYLPNKQVIVLMDDKVRGLYGKYFEDYPIIEIGQTEKNKTLSTIENIMGQLLDLNADRSTFLLAVGGGIICDIGGFAASIYLRGIEFGFISTTLLSQVDASVGGKNGVNFKGFKNMVGVFNQPSFVLCDQEMLKTLSTEDLNCGFAEIVKHTLISDAEMFEKLENNIEKALNIETDFIEALVANSVRIKAGIVNKDEKEKGERRKLNLGHTYGHAVEKVLGVAHGNAVSIGLAISAKLSLNRGTITANDYQRVVNLLKALNLPIMVTEKHEEILEALLMDKKREGNEIHFVLMHGIGDVSLELISIEELKKIEL